MTKLQDEGRVIEKALEYAYSEKIDGLDMLRFLNRYGVKYQSTEFDEAIVEWHVHALENDPEVSVVLAMWMFDEGNEETGKGYIKIGAKNNGASANSFLADCYNFGEHGFEKNDDMAASYYIKGCKYGSRDACKDTYRLLKELHKEKALSIIEEEIGYELFMITIFGIRDVYSFVKSLPRRILQRIRLYYLMRLARL